MSGEAVNNILNLKKQIKEISEKCYPDFAELILYSLERRHLDLPSFSNIIIPESEPELFLNFNLREHLKENVRLLKLDEISFDANAEVHLPGVESAITSMRGAGHSLLFIVRGGYLKTSVYIGLAKHDEDSADINSAISGYMTAWQANFPGTKINKLTTEEISDVSYSLANCKELGILTGIPSLKREEDSHIFVQGLERMIRAMRGKTYCWLSIADPVSNSEINDAIEACHKLQSDIHHLVKTELSKATSNGKTIMLGLFGMTGNSESDGDSRSESESTSKGANEGSSHTIGVNASTPVVSANYAYTLTKSTFQSVAKGITNAVNHSLSSQLGGGGFASIGRTLTKTTTVGQELLNRKAEYAEEILKSYEERLHQGAALGMWNLGHYFCASDEDTYHQGIGVVTSLFTGMDSTYEPPRALKIPTSFCSILRKFNNVQLYFSKSLEQKDEWSKLSPNEIAEKINSDRFQGHPLGSCFNGPGTLVNTKELAIATPIATQDIEGISVTNRAQFGINATELPPGEKSLVLGNILDKGNELSSRYRLILEHLNKHLSVFGLTGSGKTNTIHHLLLQLWEKHHIPFLVIEPAKAEYRALAASDELKNDLLIISAGADQTTVCPLRLNPFYFDPGQNNDANRVHVLTHIDRLKATFNASFPMYASMPYILEEAILEIYRERGWNLALSENRYADIYNEDFSDYVPTLQDLYLKVDSVVGRKGYFKEQQMNIQAALKARLSSLMVGSKGNMLNTLHSISAKDLFEKPVIIELENMGDDDEKAFLMGLLVSKLYEYRKTTSSAKNDLKHVLVIEEAHRLLANIPDDANMEMANVKGKAVTAFVDMLSEIRAFGQSVFIVDQLPSRVSPNIVKGTGAKIVHRLLAKDDREAVGWTMGMNDEQIHDLSLLRTGECVVSQDGDRKSFLCKVPKNNFHDQRSGGEVSVFTAQFKEEHADILDVASEEIDLEDGRFYNSLYSAMLAIGCGNIPDILQNIKPSRYGIISEQTFPLAYWQLVYWQDICHRMWGFFGGEYNLYLNMYHGGKQLINNPDADSRLYREAFEKYLKNTKRYIYSAHENLPGVAYSHLFYEKNTFSLLNKCFDSIKNVEDMSQKVGMVIKKVLPTIFPSEYRLDEKTRHDIIVGILFQIAPHLDPDTVIQFTK